MLTITHIDEATMTDIVERLANKGVKVSPEAIKYVQLYQSTYCAERLQQGKDVMLNGLVHFEISKKRKDHDEFVKSIKHLDKEEQLRLRKIRGKAVNIKGIDNIDKPTFKFKINV
jgi:nucleoid DNA-binding protein